MVMSATKAANHYEQGIRDKMGGVSPYNDAIGCSTVKCAAEKMENAKKGNLTLSKMKSAYKEAYS